MGVVFDRMDHAIAGMHSWQMIADALRDKANDYDIRHYHAAADAVESAIAKTGINETTHWPSNDTTTGFLVVLELLAGLKEVEGEDYLATVKQFFCEAIASL